MRYLVILLFFYLPGSLYSQEETTAPLIPDSKYLEDQFYLGITYNILLKRPPGVSQRSLSYGLFGGFIKDLPVNADRNIGFGIGLGYAINSYYTNLRAIETPDGIEYSIIGGETSFKRSKIETHSLDLPVEFRWRTSNAISHKFWRVYTGIKFSYVFSASSKFVTDSEKIKFSNDDIREFQYGLILSMGYNTFNIHAYYSLQELFKDGVSTVDGNRLGFVPFHLGIIFYIL
ncbi:MAG: porin family protein [Flavobacteriaceae bacterium]